VVKVQDGVETTIHRATSCRLIASMAPWIFLEIAWDDYLEIRINTDIVGSTRDPDAVPSKYVIKSAPPRQENVEDLSDRNNKALLRRATRYGTIIPKANTVDGGQDYLVESLREEAEQIDDLMREIRSGKTAHARGLASRLRLLLYKGGKQLPLLQHAAATKNAPLIAFTTAQPRMKLPVEAVFHIRSEIAPVYGHRFINPVDIDVWLGFTAMSLGKTETSNDRLIAHLGDTIGSHLDRNVLPEIASLKAMSFEGTELPGNQMVRYLTQVGEVALKLARDVLA